MTSATVAKTAKTGVQAQAKPEKIRRDHKVNWWLTAVVTVLSLTVLVPLYFAVVTALKTPGEAGTFVCATAVFFRRTSWKYACPVCASSY